MPTVERNEAEWQEIYDWAEGGEDWSERWGGTEMQWYGAVLPRIHRFVPARTILEIAPGFGRWSRFLKELCERLVLVDLTERCIEACRRRFAGESHIEYHVNDGRSLAMVADGSVDFVFSFDALVHAEEDVLEAYLSELATKLAPGGTGFLHHSNLGEYGPPPGRGVPIVGGALRRLGLIDGSDHWRAPSMTAAKFRRFAEAAGLVCLGQELVNWKSRRLIDCFSVFARREPGERRETPVVRNPGFMAEADRLARLAALYSGLPARG